MAMPLVTQLATDKPRWRLRAGAAVVALGLVASACTNSDTTDTSLESLDRETTSAEPAVAGQPNTSEADRPPSNKNGGFAEVAIGDGAYWSGERPTIDNAALSRSGTSNSATAAGDTVDGGPRSGSSAAKPKSLAFTDRSYEIPDRSHVATVIGAGVSSVANPAPGPAEHYFPNPTQFGNERVFLVLDATTSDKYIKVSLPVRPNGQEGWIPRDTVTISEVQHYAVVDLTTDALTVWDGDDIIVQTKAVTGKRSTPTPAGNFFVRDIIKHDNPNGAYGPYIVALSAFSEVLETFAGGLPAVAIHGTNKPWLIGGEYSSGCIRIPNDIVQKLAASVPPGTPVTILS